MIPEIKLEINKIHNIDCFEGFKQIPDSCIDLIVTSPPYNMGVSLSRGQIYDEYNDKQSEEEYEQFLIKSIDECLRTAKLTAFNIQYNTTNKKTLLRLFGHFSNHIKDIMIWHKSHNIPALAPNTLTHNYEFIIIFEKDNLNRGYKFNFGRKGETTSCFTLPPNSGVNREMFLADENAAIMPIQLARRLIQTFSSKQDLILDPFSGTGTTSLAAKQLNRNYLGFEISTKQIEVSNRRLNQQLITQWF